MTVTVVDPKPLADAVAAAITGQGIAYALGRKPTVTGGSPYIVGWPDGGTVGDSSLRMRDGWSMVIVLQHYGLSPDSVWVALKKSRAAMFSLANTTVGGRRIGLPIHGEPPPLQRDDDADPPLFWLSDEWRIPTTPA